MALNITVYPWYSPRVIQINTPDNTNVSVQELYNVIRDWEDGPEGQYYDYLIDAAGKEALGGDVFVNITATLQNAQLYFPPFSTPIDNTKTCSTADTTGRVLISSTSTFITDGLVRGDVVYNGTTGAMATILTIDSETQLTHLLLTGGSRNDWQVGDGIVTYNNPQSNLSGGNIVAVDQNNNEIPVVLAAPLVQVVRTASSSATLQEQEALQYSSYSGGVSLDVNSGNTGIDYPVGTPEYPVNNAQDAVQIIANKGLPPIIFVIGNYTFDTGDDISNHIIKGQNAILSQITINPGSQTVGCEIQEATISGTLDGNTIIRNSRISNLYYVNGVIYNSVLDPGIIQLGGSTTAMFLSCYSGDPGQNTPRIDCGGDGPPLALRGYDGGVSIYNKTGSSAVSIDLNAGQVILEDTVTAGDVVIRGTGGKVTDNSNGATIYNELVSVPNVTKGIWNALLTDYNLAGSFGNFIQKKLLTISKYLGLK